MKKLSQLFAAVFLFSLVSCSASKPVIPFTPKAEIEDTYTIIWNGSSQAYRYTDGAWVRAESYDYIFDVVQKRYDNQWKSVKNMHRVHPEYDGKAGDRNQTMYFELAYNNLKDNKVVSVISSSLGDGVGTSDKEFREQQLIMYPKDASMFMPYNKIKITQHYNYEQGILTETVELLKEKNGQDTPFMKNEEKAYFYLKGKVSGAPTTFKEK